jgi:hypothetical protein
MASPRPETTSPRRTRRDKRDRLCAGLADAGFDVLRPHGTYFATVDIRSFGENPQVVTRNVEAFIEGAESNRRGLVLTTAKHFPGHGDTATDTHLGLATITADRKHLNDVELAPFRAAIAKGVDSVMTALFCAALDSGDYRPRLPAILTVVPRTAQRPDCHRRHGHGRHREGLWPCRASVRAIEAGATWYSCRPTLRPP